MRPINDTQQKIYEFLCERSQCGVPPSVREIGSAVGLRSTSSVVCSVVVIVVSDSCGVMLLSLLENQIEKSVTPHNANAETE